MNKLFDTKLEGLVALFLFVGLWVYLWLRAIYVPLVHDELVTLHAYMLNGKWLPFAGYLDANNHLLNSALGSFFLSLFGYSSYLVPRLPNVLSFPIYFFATWQILKQLKFQKFNQLFALIALCCAPYFLEFFALARGYAMAIALFVLALWAFIKWRETNENFYLIIFAIASALSVFANLTLLFANSALLGIVFLLLIDKKSFHIRTLITLLIPLISFGFMAWYGTQLQATGKLYYGSGDGFFELTVNTLVKELFFLEGIAMQWIMKMLGVFLILLAISKAFKEKTLAFLYQNNFMVFAILLSFCLLAIFGSNLVLGVNFPEDRAALYLFPIFLFLIFSILQELHESIQKVFFILMGLVFIPLLGFNLNLSHSIFWHHDHIYPKIIELIGQEENIPTLAGKVIHQSVWGQAAKANSLNLNSLQRYKNDTIDTVADFHLALLDRYPALNNYYQSVFYDELSGLSLIKRKPLLKRKLLGEKTTNPLAGNNEFLSLWGDFPDSLKGQNLLLEIEGEINRKSFPSDLIIVASDENNQGQKAYYEVYGFDIMMNPEATATKLSMYIPSVENPALAGFYIWNKEKVDLEISELNLNLYKLTND